MADRPVIAIVDDEPDALALLLEALQRRFGADYRVAPYLTPRAAVEDLRRLKSRGEDIALVIADQQMPGMSGRELLEQVHSFEPLAKRALLVRWGDRAAAPDILGGCAYGQLDYYLTKPWSPAEVHLYPPINEFLAEWTRAYRPSLEIVKVVGDDLSPRTLEVRDLLTRSGIPHGFYRAGGPEGQRLLSETGLDPERLPVVFLADGTSLVQPTNAQIADLLAEGPSDLACDLAVVGAGPAGLAAAVYGASEGLRTVVVERESVGGQAGASSLIRNYLGFPRGITGAELAQRAYQQAWLFGAKYLLARDVTGLRARGTDRILELSDGRELTSRAVIVATGARYKRLGIPRLESLVGAGLHYTTLDPRLTLGQDVHVAGGGNAAGQAAVHLARHARHVTLLVRASSLEQGMSDYLVQQIRQLDNIDVRLGSEIVDGGGDGRLEYLEVRDRRTGSVERMAARMLFVLIGAQPHTDWLAGTVARDDRGFVLTGADVPEDAWPLARRPRRYETSMPGVFAVGDVRHGSSKRVASAVGEGSVSVQYVHEYLAEVDEGRASTTSRASAPEPSGASLQPSAPSM